MDETSDKLCERLDSKVRGKDTVFTRMFSKIRIMV